MARRASKEQSLYVISVAAELAGVHPQTLRVYERKGLVTPQRTTGNNRRYSEGDIARLRRINELTGEGLNLAGVERVIELEREIEMLSGRLQQALVELRRTQQQLQESMATRDVGALVLRRDVRRIRRAMKSDAIEEASKPRRIVAPPASE